MKLPKLEMEIEGCDTTREELTKRIPDLRAESELSADDAKKVEELKKNVEKCKSDMASCALLASKLESEVARLQKAILDAGGSKLKKQQAACDKALSNLESAEKALNAAKVTITTSAKAAKKAKENKETAETDLEKCKETLEEKQTAFKALEADALKVMQAYEEVKEVEAEKRLALEAVSKECEDLKKQSSEIKCIEIDLLGKVDAFDKQISDCDRRINHFEQEIQQLRAAEEEDDDYDVSDDESEDGEAEEKDADGDKDSTEDSGEDADVEMAGDEERSQPAEVSRTATKTMKKTGGRSSLPTLPFPSLEQYDIEDVKKDIAVLEREHNTLAKNANMGAIAEYRKKEADYLARYANFFMIHLVFHLCVMLSQYALTHYNTEYLISTRLRKNVMLHERRTKNSEGCVLKSSWTDSVRLLSS